MTLTGLRSFLDGNKSNQFVCDNRDFEVALEMVRVYREHCYLMHRTLPGGGGKVTLQNPDIRRFYEQLPERFTRGEALKLYKEMVDSEVDDSTVDKCLKRLLNKKYLTKEGQGKYVKTTSN